MMISSMSAGHKIPFVFVVLIAIIASCSRDPEHATVRKVEALIRDNHLQVAMQTADAYLEQHPDAIGLLRLRVIIALKARQIDAAVAGLQALPTGDPILTQALSHRDITVRSSAAQLAAEHAVSLESRFLIRSLSDPVPEVRSFCARALGLRRERSAVKPLFEILHDDNRFVRADAATALGRIGDSRSAGWLARTLDDGNWLVRDSAAEALREVACGENHDVLLTFFHRTAGEQQLNIALALAKLAEPAALGRLTNSVTDSTADIRRRVAEALGDYGPSATTNALVLMLEDADPNVREQAERSLSKVRQ
jgi:HEAT repeat protein